MFAILHKLFDDPRLKDIIPKLGDIRLDWLLCAVEFYSQDTLEDLYTSQMVTSDVWQADQKLLEAGEPVDLESHNANYAILVLLEPIIEANLIAIARHKLQQMEKNL